MFHRLHRLWQCLVFLIAILAFAPPSQSAQLGIVTGGSTGTYIEFGKDIQKLLARHGIGLDVHTSKGSLENVFSVYELPKAQMGIVQSDVLAYISTLSSPKAQQVASKMRLLFPLYNEEVHILASGAVSGFEDLSGRRVAVGKKGSGTELTADTILKIADIDVQPVYLGGSDALDALKRGDVDAMFYVAGFPVKLFKDNVNVSDGLQLLPIYSKSVSEIYNVSSVIPADTYSFLASDIQTVAVKATLITYAYKHDNCGRVGRVANIIESDIDWLRQNGHPKWQEVDLALNLNGWTQYECVHGGQPPNSPESDPDFEDFLKEIQKTK